MHRNKQTKSINIIKQKTMNTAKEQILADAKRLQNVAELIVDYRKAKSNCIVNEMVNGFRKLVAEIEYFCKFTHEQAFQMLMYKENECLAILEKGIAKLNERKENE